MGFIHRVTIGCVLLAVVPLLSHASGRGRFNSGGAGAFQVAAPTTGSVSVVGQAAGPTPFIVNLQLLASPPAALQSVKFTIVPKPGSVTRPISATYFADYLQGRGYFNLQTGNVTVPVFGLYANYSNTVNLTYCFSDGSSQQTSAMINTPPFADPCGHDNPTVIRARTNTTELSYDFILVRTSCGTQSPFILDTDGAVRWVGTLGQVSTASLFFNNAIYMGSKPANSSSTTGLSRIELDGMSTFLNNYSSLGVTNIHHNLDPGKYGMLLEVDTATQVESTILEVDTSGNVLKRWDLADIIGAAMMDGGDDPTQFVKPAPNDWFHSNAVAYRESDDTLVVSAREDFVIALDYETGAIKWILGDSTKHWYQFQSLRNYALSLAPYSLPPIGQHAVSFTHNDELLLFDNGETSLNHVPAGQDRTYNSPRRYRLDLQAKTATEVWNYPVGQTFDSRFCSSVYEDNPSNYLVDYAIISNLGPQNLAELVGLTAAGNKVFEYRYPTVACNTAYNSIPLHWENVIFTGPAEDPLRVTGISTMGLNRAFSFNAIAGRTYRLEYNPSLSDPNWAALGDQVASCSGPTQLVEPSQGPTNGFYRVRQLPTPSPTPINPIPVNDSVVGTGTNQWQYDSGWFYIAVTGTPFAFQQDEHYATGTTAAVAHFRFQGTQVKIYTIKEPNDGNIGYSLDGGPEQIISNYAPTVTAALSYTSPVVSVGNHDLVIRVVGTREPAASANAVTVDKAEVFGAPP